MRPRPLGFLPRAPVVAQGLSCRLPPQLEQFKKDNMDTGFGSGTRALEQALEKTKANIKWVNANKETIKNWFATNSK